MDLIKKIFSYFGSRDLEDVQNTSDSNDHLEYLQIKNALDLLPKQERENLVSNLCAGLKDDVGEFVQFQTIEAICQIIYPKYKFSEYGRLFLEDKEFISYYKRFMDVNNWHSLDRKYTLNELLKLCAHLEGDLVECGTYKGATAFLMCKAFQNDHRIIHLFDSFEGLSQPGSFDGDYWIKGALGADEKDVEYNLYHFSNYRIYKGWIPERFFEVSDLTFCFLHIDVDLYEPTLASLNYFYVRMTIGGIILMDDYGFKSCPGAKMAADEFFYDKPENIIMLPTGQAFIIKQ